MCVSNSTLSINGSGMGRIAPRLLRKTGNRGVNPLSESPWARVCLDSRAAKTDRYDNGRDADPCEEIAVLAYSVGMRPIGTCAVIVRSPEP